MKQTVRVSLEQTDYENAAFFALHTRKNILRDWFSYLLNDVLERME